MANKEKKLIRFDWAMKKILRSKANFGVLEGFLSELLKEDIKIKNILESEGNKETADDKFNRVDMLVENSKGELIIIEVQVQDQIDYIQRIVYGTAKAITEYIKESQKYGTIKKIISVNILYFDLGQGKDYVYYGTTRFNGIHEKDELQLSPEQSKEFKKSHFYELFPEYYLIKTNRFNDLAKDTLDEWIYFLKNETIKTSFKAKGLKEAKQKLDIMKQPKAKQDAYKKYLESLMDKSSFYDSTYVRGEKKGVEKVARNLKKKGMSVADITETTGLSREEIKKL